MKFVVHALKCWPESFQAILRGEKRFEFRINDRDYRVGDYLNLREWDDDKAEYSGSTVSVVVTHILYGGRFGVPAGYCVMSISRVDKYG